MVSQMIFSGFRKKENAEIDVSDARLACETCASHGLTGVSLFNEGVFLTILEGSKEETKAIFEAYKKDTRVTGVHLIIENAIDEREFSDFRIGFSHVDFSETVPKAFKLNGENYKKALPKNPSNELEIMTKTFARVNAL